MVTQCFNYWRAVDLLQMCQDHNLFPVQGLAWKLQQEPVWCLETSMFASCSVSKRATCRENRYWCSEILLNFGTCGQTVLSLSWVSEVKSGRWVGSVYEKTCSTHLFPCAMACVFLALAALHSSDLSQAENLHANSARTHSKRAHVPSSLVPGGCETILPATRMSVVSEDAFCVLTAEQLLLLIWKHTLAYISLSLARIVKFKLGSIDFGDLYAHLHPFVPSSKCGCLNTTEKE